ncbi:MAG: hypothetical protein IPK81_01025 [Rhodospirillales bacterium]|nr:MAG: hypothetical protein IPK81_01025 [Rhodospirillales bacterium]
MSLCREAAVIVAALAALGTVSTAAARDLKRCDELAAYYDRYSDRVGEGRMPVGRLERELGYDACRKGDHEAGLRMLEEAIRRNGFNVPRS